MKWTPTLYFLRICKLHLVSNINGCVFKVVIQACCLWFLRFSRLLGSDIRRMEDWAGFKCRCFYLPAQGVKSSEASEQHRNPWAILKRDTGLRITVKLWWFDKLCCCLLQAGEAHSAGHVTRLMRGRHRNVHLNSQPPWSMRGCVNKLDSSSGLKVEPVIPAWCDV